MKCETILALIQFCILILLVLYSSFQCWGLAGSFVDKIRGREPNWLARRGRHFGEEKLLVARDLRPLHVARLRRVGAHFVSDLWIGNPPVKFTVAVDTGSTNTWVASSACDQCPTENRSLYDQDASVTSVDAREAARILYLNNHCEGPNILDDVNEYKSLGKSAIAGRVKILGNFRRSDRGVVPVHSCRYDHRGADAAQF